MDGVEVERSSPIDATLVEGVLGWWPELARGLPWRSSRDPWEILVSETMAQQTQVERVVPAWHRFLEIFPTPADAASARVGAIVEAWAGLGYNRRAVRLHACATTVVHNHEGRIPARLDLLLTLPGVGPYTARAVLAFAFEEDVAVVDTNVGRVLARWAGRALGPAEVQQVADRLVPAGSGWTWNQAILDFGALQCTKRAPQCGRCPVRRSCAWAGAGDDPASGSARVSSGQPRFSGSDRQGRGRLVDALRVGDVPVDQLAIIMGWPDEPDRAARVADRVVRDGLAVDDGSTLHLP